MHRTRRCLSETPAPNEPRVSVQRLRPAAASGGNQSSPRSVRTTQHCRVGERRQQAVAPITVLPLRPSRCRSVGQGRRRYRVGRVATVRLARRRAAPSVTEQPRRPSSARCSSRRNPAAPGGSLGGAPPSREPRSGSATSISNVTPTSLSCAETAQLAGDCFRAWALSDRTTPMATKGWRQSGPVGTGTRDRVRPVRGVSQSTAGARHPGIATGSCGCSNMDVCRNVLGFRP
jgi:hypothetical protein